MPRSNTVAPEEIQTITWQEIEAEGYITLLDASERSGRSEATLRNHAKSGDLPAVFRNLPGTRLAVWFVREADLEAFQAQVPSNTRGNSRKYIVDIPHSQYEQVAAALAALGITEIAPRTQSRKRDEDESADQSGVTAE